VLSVTRGSPAQQAGLHPYVDYILGTNTCVFHGLDSFEEFVSKNLNEEVHLKVYNSNLCQIRDVKVIPAMNWSDVQESESVLGCEIGSGLLHKVPDIPEGAHITARDESIADFLASSDIVRRSPKLKKNFTNVDKNEMGVGTDVNFASKQATVS